jgi:hypothetical protein
MNTHGDGASVVAARIHTACATRLMKPPPASGLRAPNISEQP